MIVSVYLSAFVPYNRLAAIVLYVGMVVFVYKYSPYRLSSLYRLYFTLFVGFMIQTLLLVRSALLQEATNETYIGRIESSLGVYFPYSIVISLLLICMIAIAYSIYGIQKTRCCELETDWQKINMDELMKVKLESLIAEQADDKDKFSAGNFVRSPPLIGQRRFTNEQPRKDITEG